MKPGNTEFCLNLKMYGTETVQGKTIENSSIFSLIRMR